MSALDFITSDDTSDVVFSDVPSEMGNDAVVRGSERRFEGKGYAGVPNVKGFSKAVVPKPSVRRSGRRMPKPSGESEHFDLDADVEVSVGDEDVKDKKGELVSVGKKKVESKKGSGSVGELVGDVTLEKGLEGSSSGKVYVPCWQVKEDDSFKDPDVCADALANFPPPSVRGAISRMDSEDMLSRLVLSSCNLSALLAEGVTRFRKGVKEYEDFAKRREKMKASLAGMKKEVEGFAVKEEAWVKKVGDIMRRHEAEVDGLNKKYAVDVVDVQKWVKAEKEKIQADREALEVQRKIFEEEKGGLKASLSQALQDNQWLIQDGFQQVVTYLLHSAEFNRPLGEVYSKMMCLGKHLGFVAGYEAGKAGEDMKKSPMFNPDAHEVFKDSVKKMERLTYPYVGEVSSCFGKPLSFLQGLKPHGLKEDVCEEVFRTIASNKRAREADSEDTLSGDPEGSKATSHEVSGIEAPRQAKKVKKTKKSKKDDGTGSSKPTE